MSPSEIYVAFAKAGILKPTASSSESLSLGERTKIRVKTATYGFKMVIRVGPICW